MDLTKKQWKLLEMLSDENEKDINQLYDDLGLDPQIKGWDKDLNGLLNDAMSGFVWSDGKQIRITTMGLARWERYLKDRALNMRWYVTTALALAAFIKSFLF